MQKPKKLFLATLILTALAIFIDLPREIPINITRGPFKLQRTLTLPKLDLTIGPLRLRRDLEVHQGLDLKGGTHLVFEAQMGGVTEENREDALKSAREIITRRVDLYGVSEPLIQTSITGGEYRIIVELPGIQNPQEAIELIGQTAQLDFRAPPEEDEASPSAQQLASVLDYRKTDLTGADLAKAQVQFDQSQTGQPVVALFFSEAGKQKFSELTQDHVGDRLAIFLDDQLLTAPVVKEAITSGEAIISSEGGFTLTEAKSLAVQLNAGALPVPIRVVSERSVGATLGQESVVKSLRAGAIGLCLVMFFMAAYYGRLGLIADAALVTYGILTLAIYKLVPITLTLPGLAGFILSVGMAVDSNILIFERMKEELRAGRPWRAALEVSFGRAWDSIKDANVATLITCFVLLNPFEWSFLARSGMARGFALTLALGVLTSLFTGIIITRTLLRVLYTRDETTSRKQ